MRRFFLSVYFRLQSTRPVWGATCQTHSDFVEPGISIHAPAWGATSRKRLQISQAAISIHAPAWGATMRQKHLRLLLPISIHAPAWGATLVCNLYVTFNSFQSTRPRGARPHPVLSDSQNTPFQSTRPRGARLSAHRKRISTRRFQSTRPRGARLSRWSFLSRLSLFQSTRPAWGRDDKAERSGRCPCNFNPRAPHGGATKSDCLMLFSSSFQSTRPAWGRDYGRSGQALAYPISIHAPRMGARHMSAPSAAAQSPFQSTRPAWGRDALMPKGCSCRSDFNPRAPHGGATWARLHVYMVFFISIHAPRMGARHSLRGKRNRRKTFQSTRPAWGRDIRRLRTPLALPYFNPRAPHGGATHVPACAFSANLDFNPRAPHGGATAFVPLRSGFGDISIHAPRMGARREDYLTLPPLIQFQSTRPAWGRDPSSPTRTASSRNFNPRAPHGGATYGIGEPSRADRYFNPRAPHGGATGLENGV